MQPEDFDSVAAMPTFFLTNCGHVLCGPCTNNNLTFCTKCGSSPIQMMAISDDMPDDIKVLFQDVGDSIKSIYKGNMFQSAHTEHLFEGMVKDKDQKETGHNSKVDSLTKEIEALKLKMETLEDLKLENERLKEKIKQNAKGNGNVSRKMFYGAETSPARRKAQYIGSARANHHFGDMVTSPPVKRKDGAQQRPKAPFVQRRRPDEVSFPDGMSVHPLLTAKTPDELRKALMDPLNLGRPKPASQMPRGAQSPPYVRRLDMDAVERNESRKRTAYQMPREARTPPHGRRHEMEQREALRKMVGSPPRRKHHEMEQREELRKMAGSPPPTRRHEMEQREALRKLAVSPPRRRRHEMEQREELRKMAGSPPLARRHEMEKREALRKKAGSPPRGRRHEMEKRRALRKMAGSPPLNMFPW